MKPRPKRQPPKNLRAIQTSRHFHVIKHRHTGHLTHHRSTSYPVLAMILLCVGVFLASWTHFVTADSFVYPGPVTNGYVVHASVPGPPPTTPATIDSPTEDTVFADLPITVSGTCPLSTYVNLYRNGAFSGTALCQIDGTYQLQTSLFLGINELKARVYSLTDVAGPISNTVVVSYSPPVPPTPVGGPSGSGGSTKSNPKPSAGSSSVVAGEPLIFKTTFAFEGHYVGDPSTWQIDIEGGTAPYAIAVDWGDGQHNLISRSKAGTFNLSHTYKKAGGYRGAYVTKFTASDANDEQTFLQLIAIVNNPPNGVGATKPKGFSNVTPGYLKDLMKYVWPGYGIVVLMLTSFWLGERREYHLLKPRLRKTRRGYN